MWCPNVGRNGCEHQIYIKCYFEKTEHPGARTNTCTQVAISMQSTTLCCVHAIKNQNIQPESSKHGCGGSSNLSPTPQLADCFFVQEPYKLMGTIRHDFHVNIAWNWLERFHVLSWKIFTYPFVKVKVRPTNKSAGMQTGNNKIRQAIDTFYEYKLNLPFTRLFRARSEGTRSIERKAFVWLVWNIRPPNTVKAGSWIAKTPTTYSYIGCRLTRQLSSAAIDNISSKVCSCWVSMLSVGSVSASSIGREAALQVNSPLLQYVRTTFTNTSCGR